MANEQLRPRILVGDATGTWKCKIVSAGIAPKDIRLLHRAIDVEFKRYTMSRRQTARRQRADDSLRAEAAARRQVEMEAAEKLEEEINAAKVLVEQSETKKDSESKTNSVEKAEVAETGKEK